MAAALEAAAVAAEAEAAAAVAAAAVEAAAVVATVTWVLSSLKAESNVFVYVLISVINFCSLLNLIICVIISLAFARLSELIFDDKVSVFLLKILNAPPTWSLSP